MKIITKHYGIMNMFRELNEEEQKEFKQWARDNYVPGQPINEAYHPVIQRECALMNEERKAPQKTRKNG